MEDKPSVLIVDDMPENLDLLRATLMDSHLVRVALDGATALKIVEDGIFPDIILLDIMMPQMDGYEVLRRLQQIPGARDIPVIFITTLADRDKEVMGLQAGAVDYITKPFSPAVVHARVATHLALRQARQALEERNMALLRERRLVEDVIIRMRSSRHFDERKLRHLMSPVDRTNGDILLASFTPDGRQWLLVGDFTGHGLPAAVGAPLVAHVFYQEAANGGQLGHTLSLINDLLCEQLPVEIFMAATAVEIDAGRAAARIWSGGMPEGLLLDAQGSVRTRVPATGMPPLGILPAFDYASAHQRLTLARGDRFYVFSDGITDVAAPDGRLFELSDLEGFLSTLTAQTPLATLIDVLADFHGSTSFRDDITLAEIQV